MAKAKFYYDELMNDDRSTFSVYLFDDGNEDTDLRTSRSYQGKANVKELLRGLISQDPSMTTQVVWNGSPLNLTSAWANIASSLKTASRNLNNAANNIKNVTNVVENTVTGGKSGAILNWNQDAFYSVNEFQKTFGGITTSTPLVINALILPYLDSENKYHDVKSQLNEFLTEMYKNEGYNDSQTVTDIRNSEVDDTNDSGNNFFMNLLKKAVTAIPNLLNWGASTISKLNNDVLNSNNYVLTLKPPHGYHGIPIDFVEDQWMENTLAIRIGSRQLYNLLISTISITVSKEMTIHNNELSPTSAQINLSFVPVLILKPSEIKEYVLDNIQPSNIVTTSPKPKKDPKSFTPYYREDEFE